MFEKQKERTFLYYSGANELLDIKHFKLNEIKNNPKILYVGYLSLLGKLDYFDGKETRLCKVLKEARKKNLITILDLASNNIPNFQKIIFSSLPYTDYLLLNEIEAQLLFNTSLLNSNNQLNQKLIIKLSKKAFQKGLRKALVIHSPLESLYISKDNSCHSKSIKIPKKNIKNAVGAGDAFCAGFVFGIHEEWDIETTLKKSHAAGSAMMKIDSSSGNLPNIKNL
jgi:sugar/nucleoside kinase (ribokinase family)